MYISPLNSCIFSSFCIIFYFLVIEPCCNSCRPIHPIPFLLKISYNVFFIPEVRERSTRSVRVYAIQSHSPPWSCQQTKCGSVGVRPLLYPILSFLARKPLPLQSHVKTASISGQSQRLLGEIDMVECWWHKELYLSSIMQSFVSDKYHEVPQSLTIYYSYEVTSFTF